MKNTFYAGVVLLFLTILMIIIGIFKGFMGFGIYIFPVIYGSGLYAGLAFIALMLSMIIIILSIFDQPEGVKSEFGGVILIGPVPIVFGNSKIMIVLTVLVAVILIILLII